MRVSVDHRIAVVDRCVRVIRDGRRDRIGIAGVDPALIRCDRGAGHCANGTAHHRPLIAGNRLTEHCPRTCTEQSACNHLATMSVCHLDRDQ